MSYRSRRSFLKKHLRINLDLEFNERNQEKFNQFAENYLGGDGILYLKLIEKNTNPVIAGNDKPHSPSQSSFSFRRTSRNIMEKIPRWKNSLEMKKKRIESID